MDHGILKTGVPGGEPYPFKQGPAVQLAPGSAGQLHHIQPPGAGVARFCVLLHRTAGVGFVAILPAALHDIRTGLLRFLQKRRNRSRQQYIVTVHKQKIFSFCLQNPGIACLRCTSTGFFRQLNPSDFSPVCIFLQDIATAVCRIVVDCNNFHCIAALLRQNAVQTLP